MMDIQTSQVCNLLSLELLSDYLNEPFEKVENFYRELSSDKVFIEGLNDRINACYPYYRKGLFNHKNIDSVDWFGNQRITLYVLIRLLRPAVCVETGVFYGGSTAFILNAIQKNKSGRLISIDLPGDRLRKETVERHSFVGDSEIIPPPLKTGFIIPEFLKTGWQLITGNSLEVLERLNTPFSFFSHDSEHSHTFMQRELTLAMSKMEKSGVILVDDINWSNGFFEFCVKHKKYPLILPDNGKNGLQARLGIVKLNHKKNSMKMITG